MKAKYLLPCSCGRQTPVEASQAGQQIKCRCGAAVEVPAMRGLAQLERAVPEPATEGASPADVPTRAGPRTSARSKAAAALATSAWGTRQRLLLIGGLLTLLGLGMAGYFYLFRPQVVDAERMAPITTWLLWYDLRHGIEQRPDWEAFYLESLAKYRRWMIVAALVAAVGALVMASSLLAPGRRRGRRVGRPGPGGRTRELRRAT